MQDLYKLLGVAKSASQDEIKKAYRGLAKKLHPDRNPGDEKVAEKFKEVSAAYAILGDKDQRAKYDSGEIDASGAMRNPFAGAGPDARHSEVFEEILRNFTGGRGFGGARGGARSGTFEFTGSAEDIFADLFSFGGGRRQARRQPMKGRDVVYQMTVPFMEAVKGSTRRLTLQTGRTLDVKIPEGVAEGQQIRLKGQGEAGVAGGPAGDAMIKVHIAPHPYFRRDGNNIHLDVPITVDEAVLGASIKVPTVSGNVTLKIPKGTSSGARLRLKGKGVKSGDQIVAVKIMLPKSPDPELEKAIAEWREKAGYKVRQTFGVD